MTAPAPVILVVVDVDGVVSPLHGHTAWGDDVVAGYMAGPVQVSPTMCVRLDKLARMPGVNCVWLTSWSTMMRAAMPEFPGLTWRDVAEQGGRQAPTSPRWWKVAALEEWLDQHPDVVAVAWCDDHLSTPARRHAARKALNDRGLDHFLVGPDAAVGLTPRELDALERWVHLRTPLPD